MRLRVNGKVPGRRPIKNPHTCSGFPLWNTFAPLGIKSTTRDAGQALFGLKGKTGTVARPPRRLAPQNLAHRTSFDRDLRHGLFNRARVLSLKIDSAKGQALEDLLRQYTQDVLALRDLGARGLLDQLIHKEKSRGVVRCTFTLRNSR